MGNFCENLCCFNVNRLRELLINDCTYLHKSNGTSRKIPVAINLIDMGATRKWDDNHDVCFCHRIKTVKHKPWCIPVSGRNWTQDQSILQFSTFFSVYAECLNEFPNTSIPCWLWKCFYLITLYLKKASLVWDQSDYSRLKTAHNYYNCQKQPKQAGMWSFLNTLTL